MNRVSDDRVERALDSIIRQNNLQEEDEDDSQDKKKRRKRKLILQTPFEKKVMQMSIEKIGQLV